MVRPREMSINVSRQIYRKREVSCYEASNVRKGLGSVKRFLHKQVSVCMCVCICVGLLSG